MRQILLALTCIAVLVTTAKAPHAGDSLVTLTVPNSTLVRAVGRSQLALLSDLSWVRTIGYSIHLSKPIDGLALLAWARFTTELDERFFWPYLLGGLLGVINIDGVNYNVAESEALLQRGTEKLPGEFRIAMYLSFSQLYLSNHPAEAARTLERAAGIPGAPKYLGPLATRLLAQTNQFDAARSLAQALVVSGDAESHDLFERRLLEVERDEGAVRIESAIKTFEASRGHAPSSLAELKAEGLLQEIPVDPLGGDYVIKPDGGVDTTSGPRLQAHLKF